MGYFLLTALLLVSMFLMLVILIQRGRGGGLAGAFGGLGGQSAFGTKAGDVFTWATIVAAVIWVALACLSGWALRKEAEGYYADREGGADKVQMAPGDKADDSKTGDDAKKDSSDTGTGTKSSKKAEEDSTEPGAGNAQEKTLPKPGEKPAEPDTTKTSPPEKPSGDSQPEEKKE